MHSYPCSEGRARAGHGGTDRSGVQPSLLCGLGARRVQGTVAQGARCRGRCSLGTGQRLTQAWLCSCGLCGVEQITSPGWASVPSRKEKVRTNPHVLFFQPVEALLTHSLIYQTGIEEGCMPGPRPGARDAVWHGRDACLLPWNLHFSKETDNK